MYIINKIHYSEVKYTLDIGNRYLILILKVGVDTRVI